MTYLGYLLGNVLPVKDHIDDPAGYVVGISVLPIVFEYVKQQAEAHATQ